MALKYRSVLNLVGLYYTAAQHGGMRGNEQ